MGLKPGPTSRGNRSVGRGGRRRMRVCKGGAGLGPRRRGCAAPATNHSPGPRARRLRAPAHHDDPSNHMAAQRYTLPVFHCWPLWEAISALRQALAASAIWPLAFMQAPGLAKWCHGCTTVPLSMIAARVPFSGEPGPPLVLVPQVSGHFTRSAAISTHCRTSPAAIYPISPLHVLPFPVASPLRYVSSWTPGRLRC